MTTPSDAAIARAFWKSYAFSEKYHQEAYEILKDIREMAGAAEPNAEAEPEKIHCPKCRGNYPVGRHCAGSPDNPCPLKVKDD